MAADLRGLQRELRVLESEQALCGETFRSLGVPHARINDYARALTDPQVAHMGWIQHLDLPSGRGTRTFASPLRVDGEGFAVRKGPPALGEHTEAIRAELISEGPR
ncbi:CoA transferase [Caenimonas soli]|uniref:CoA transferase n=1 Tax=Caenimonas soli TaxID=2735555 RepID=UPI002E29DBA3|nr:CoA transferase [Caenimonas soli]